MAFYWPKTRKCYFLRESCFNPVALLQQLAPRLSDADADAIARMLDNFPLALQLAGGYLDQLKVGDYYVKRKIYQICLSNDSNDRCCSS